MMKYKNKISIALFSIFLIITIPICFADTYKLIYDNNGNLITGDGKYREYDEFNRLIRVRAGYDENGPKLEEYLWHPAEERILVKKVYPLQENDVTTHDTYVYVNENLVIYYNHSIGGDTDFVYIKDETGIVAEKRENEQPVFYHNNHLGSTTLITNSTGQVVENTFYEPFGGIVAGGSRRYDYEGKEFSDSTRDYDFHFRKYDTGLKIFTQPDSLLPNVYDPQQLNRYSFERNNPYGNKDETGHFIQALPLVVLVLGIYVIGSFSQAVANAKLEEAKKKGDKEEITNAQIEFYTSPVISAFGLFQNPAVTYFGLLLTGKTVMDALNLLNEQQNTYNIIVQQRNEIINTAVETYGQSRQTSGQTNQLGNIQNRNENDPFNFQNAITKWLEKNPGKKEELMKETKYK